MFTQGNVKKTGLIFFFAALMMAMLAACGTTEVIKEVPVEKIVEKQVVKEVPVEKIVETIKEVPVEKIVEVEKIKEVIVEVAPERKKREIVFGGLNWDSALVQNGVARYIVEHGYGYPTLSLIHI